MSASLARAGTGTILKMSDGVAQTVTVATGGAAIGATSVPVNALTAALSAGNTLSFGGAKTATLTAPAAAGATTLAVSALPAALAAGDTAVGVENYATITELTDITPPSAQANTFETTHHLSPGGVMEFGVGLTDPGDVTFTVNWLPSDPTHDAATGFQKAADDKQLRRFKIIYPFLPVKVHNFRGLVTGIAYTAPLGDRSTAAVTVKCSGKPTLDAA